MWINTTDVIPDGGISVVSTDSCQKTKAAHGWSALTKDQFEFAIVCSNVQDALFLMKKDKFNYPEMHKKNTSGYCVEKYNLGMTVYLNGKVFFDQVMKFIKSMSECNKNIIVYDNSPPREYKFRNFQYDNGYRMKIIMDLLDERLNIF